MPDDVSMVRQQQYIAKCREQLHQNRDSLQSCDILHCHPHVHPHQSRSEEYLDIDREEKYSLIISFFLNITLLLRKPPQHMEHIDGDTYNIDFQASHTCLVQNTCKPGTHYSCTLGTCVPCPRDTYQPTWSQSTCWPCPVNTSTDGVGASRHVDCKYSECGYHHHHQQQISVLSSPNFPNNFPAMSTCLWRIRSEEDMSSGGLLIIIPSLSLPPNCSYSLSVYTSETAIYKSCKSTSSPTMIPIEQSDIRVQFDGIGSDTKTGFQMTIMTVPKDLQFLMEMMVNDGNDRENSIATKLIQNVLDVTKKDQLRFNNIISLLAQHNLVRDRDTDSRPLLQVTRERKKKDFVVVERRKV